jgi:hypothetical protein
MLCNYAECHVYFNYYDECYYAECRYAECHYAACHYAECSYAECSYAECHSDEKSYGYWAVFPRGNSLDTFPFHLDPSLFPS